MRKSAHLASLFHALPHLLMRRWVLPVCLLLLAGASLRAAPYGPDGKLTEFTQPDGTRISLRVFGDEFYARTETLDGYTVVFDPSAKAYFYARRSADGQRLESTSLLAGGIVPKSAMMDAHIAIDQSAAAAQAAARRSLWEQQTGLRERWEALKELRRSLDSNGPSVKAPPDFPTLGNKIGLTLLIDFSDDPAEVPQADVVSFLNGDNYTGYDNNGSVKKYFLDNSDGKLTYSNVVTAYIRMARPKTYYNDTSKECGGQGNLLIKDALDILKASPSYSTAILPLFSSLTVDGSKRVVACNVFYAGGNGGAWTYGLWPHSWSLINVGAQELSVGGMKVWKYQITDIGSSLELGTFCHENGHMLCGYPDVYDYDYDSRGGAGKFCLMNSGGHGANPTLICAYLKNVAGWATVTDIVDPSLGVGSLVAAPETAGYNQFYRFRKPGVTTEYFLLENRQRSGRDANLPASGIAIWHVDELGDHNNQSLAPNTTHANYEVTLVQADNLWHLQNDVNSGDATDLFFDGNTAAAYNNMFYGESSPSAKWWDGSASRLRLQDFSASGPTMTFSWNFYVSPPEVRITKPSKGTIALPGSTLVISATASDLTGSGMPGTIEKLEILANGKLLASFGTPPYDFLWSPADGSFTLQARATDDEGEVGLSDSVDVEVRPPRPGETVPDFAPPSADDVVRAFSSDRQGRIYIGGAFTALDDTLSAPRVARLLPSGAPDNTFLVGSGFDGDVRVLLHSESASGLYVGGVFTTCQGQPRVALARLTVGQAGRADASADADFAPLLGGPRPVVNAIVEQYDGKILVGGSFSSVNGISITNLARLNPDGSVDSAFKPPSPFGPVNALAIQPDGKVLIGGGFSQVAGQPRRGLARLNLDGTLDTTFVVGSGFAGTVNSVAVAATGSIYAGGQFRSYKGRSFYNNLVKLSATGSLDGRFNYALDSLGGLNGAVNNVQIRPTGEVLVTGLFTQIANSVIPVAPTTVGRVVQLKPDGSIDPAFNPGGSGANSSVLNAATLADGNLAVVGAFSSFNGEPVSRIALIAGSDGIVPVLTSGQFRTVAAGGDLNLFFTSSAVPGAVEFELVSGTLPRGVTFDPVTGHLHGIPLDAGAFPLAIRPRQAPPGASGETVSFTLQVLAEAVSYDKWRRAWFTGGELTDDAVSGPAAPAPNVPGLSNLAVYAMSGGNPFDPASTQAPSLSLVWYADKQYWAYSASKYPLASAVYTPQVSQNLAYWASENTVSPENSPLATLENTTDFLRVRSTVPIPQANRQFFRLRVTVP
jgi:M6 family metalloprotease-like protein/uncharacterized delta-60 repeat protein